MQSPEDQVLTSSKTRHSKAVLKEKRVAVCCNKFPVVSQTFVVDHVMNLLRDSWHVWIVCNDIDVEIWPLFASRLVDTSVADNLKVVALQKHVDEIAYDLMRGRGYLLREFGFLYWWRLRGLRAHRRIRVGVMRAAFARIRPHVVHAHFGPNAVNAAAALRYADTPLIAEFHGYDLTCHSHQSEWVLYRRYLRNAAPVVHSRFAARRLNELLQRKATILPLGVSMSRHLTAPRADRWPSVLKLLVVGRLVHQKGQAVALEMLKLLGSDISATLTIVGDGNDRSMLHALSRELGIDDRVRFAGALPHDQVVMMMKSCDILIVPSRTGKDGWEEAFGLVAAEGMTLGMAVIGTDSGGLAETVGSGGIVVTQNCASALADGIRAVLKSGSPSDWAKRARRRAADFDGVRAARMMEQFMIQAAFYDRHVSEKEQQ